MSDDKTRKETTEVRYDIHAILWCGDMAKKQLMTGTGYVAAHKANGTRTHKQTNTTTAVYGTQ